MGTQRPAESLSLKSGNCRDYALVMIEAARGLGFATRLVSGYLYEPSLNGPPPLELGSGLQQGARQEERLGGGDEFKGLVPPMRGSIYTCPGLAVCPSILPMKSLAAPT
jgi:hypothetical protein